MKAMDKVRLLPSGVHGPVPAEAALSSFAMNRSLIVLDTTPIYSGPSALMYGAGEEEPLRKSCAEVSRFKVETEEDKLERTYALLQNEFLILVIELV
ncbi:hypothetical protein AVEN_29348-1 [Araneus ventricosus]|uniref:Uncharacterized protein n=1 Tax=Araneus ventricosus TaxID=182803 RepID=A0A4Y2IXJ2_ARAVE|nr:hypothetical protein AVEN_29348-1 [Araneus ventricosus]